MDPDWKLIPGVYRKIPGNGYAISGLYINKPAEDKVGLFGCSNGTVNGVCIVNSYICGRDYVGGLAGYTDYGTFSDCSVSGFVKGTNCVGGLIGKSESWKPIDNLVNHADVYGESEVAGIAGYLMSDDTIKNCRNCVNYGTIYASRDCAGGIAGSGDAQYSQNHGNITGANYVGGIVGSGAGAIEYCQNFGEISGTNYVGGIAGNQGAVYCQVQYCQNSENITGTDYVGGITGYTKRAERSDYYITIQNSYNTGDISGENYVGGITGYTDIDAIIQNSYNTGGISGNSYAGGITGEMHTSGLENCYSLGAITYTSTSGGIAGSADVNMSVISNCYYLKEGEHNASLSAIGNGTGDWQSAVGKSTTELQQRDTYDSWADFSAAWVISNLNEGYPYLSGLYPDEISTTGVRLNRSYLSLNADNSETLCATVFPHNATSKGVSWSSSNPAAAFVSNGTVTAGTEGGTATITVTTEDGGYTGECTVTVIVPVTGVKLNKESLELTVGNSETLIATVEPSDASDPSVAWTSSEPTVAEVSDGGVVKALTVGTAVITAASADGPSDTCTVTVADPPSTTVPVTGVTLNETSATIEAGKTLTLTATVAPDDATNQNVTWSSSDPEFATVDNGTVTALKAGETTITVKTADGGHTAQCEVTVTEASSDPVPVTGVTLNETSATIEAGKTLTLTATVAPDDATNQNVTWSSSAPEFATVDNGTVTALKAGETTITVKTADGGHTAQCEVTVTEASSDPVPVTGVKLNKTSLSLTVGGSEKLTATITPSDATNQTVSWKSSDDSVASVSAGGTVTAKKAGTAKITAASADGPSATCNVTVTEASTAAAYTITFNANGGSVSPATRTTGTDGKLTSLPTPIRDDYTFDGWFTSASGGTEITTATVFTSDMTIYAHWIADWYDPINYRIYLYSDPSRGGSVYGGGTYRRGEYATVSAYPASGYSFLCWTEDGRYVSSSIDYTFTVTRSRTLTAEFERITSGVSSSGSATASHTTNTGATVISTPSASNNPALRNPYIKNTVDSMPRMPSIISIPSIPSTPSTSSASSSPFSDVPGNSTFAPAITWARNTGIMSGYADGTFRPYAGTNRQQMWMALARLSGANPASMAEARTWAINAGISDGSDAEGTMNRQQMATMVYRFAKSQGITTSGAADLSAYFDSRDVAPYAREAMAWAVGNGFIPGVSDGTLKAGSTAVRAHFAMFLYRFNSL